MSRQLLLLSTSRVHGQPYLAYCQEILQRFWGEQRELLFIPFASQDYERYAHNVNEQLEPLGFRVRSLHNVANQQRALAEAPGLFVGGGNSFLLLKTLYERELLQPIRERVLSGAMRYMGSSAGSNMACPTLKTTNDMPIVYPPSFEALNLIPFQLNPHYLDPDPSSTHMGETRADRIREFHEWNSTPVLGLREGALLEIHGAEIQLHGEPGARLFRRNQEPQELRPGDALAALLIPENETSGVS